MIVSLSAARSTTLIGSGLLLSAFSMRSWLPLRVKRNCVVSVSLRVSDAETVPSKDAGSARSSRAGNSNAIAIANPGIVARFKAIQEILIFCAARRLRHEILKIGSDGRLANATDSDVGKYAAPGKEPPKVLPKQKLATEPVLRPKAAAVVPSVKPCNCWRRYLRTSRCLTN